MSASPVVVVASGIVCPACEKPIYAGIYHKCGEPYRIGGPEGEIISIPEPPPVRREFSEPPQVTQTSGRSRCEACGESVQPNVFHKCLGNTAVHAVEAAGISMGGDPASETRPVLINHNPADAPLAGSEREKYEKMWSHDQYRVVSPGEEIASLFLETVKPRNGAKVLDFGCGTGRGSLAIAILANTGGIDLDLRMIDFADNCLDPHVVDTINGQKVETKTRLSFTRVDLTKTIPEHLISEFGYCTDVMEHIPPEDVDRVLQNILMGARHVFFQIALKDDVCGKLIGEPLHLSVHPAAWWIAKFTELKCQIHYTEENEQNLVAYVTAWSDGQDVVDVGVLNVLEETIREQVRTNVRGGWKQVEPHLPNDKEVLLLGGGPSLEGQYETIKFLRDRGAILVTMNGSYNWALEKGLSVSGTIVVDARDFNARFTHPVVDKVHYLIGSQVHPSVLEGLPKDRTYLWHTTAEMIQDILEAEYGAGKWYGVVGGCTVLTRGIPLLRMLGYAKFHLFGCDSCLEPVAPQEAGDSSLAHHAYAQPENDGMVIIPVIVGGRRFKCHPWMLAQAQEFMNLVKFLGDLFQIQVHGEGLLSWILEHASNELQVQEDLKRSSLME